MADVDKLLDFALFVAKEVCDEGFEEEAGAFAEIACRKLHKLGLIETDGKNWVWNQPGKTKPV